jgi:hypothetical protein
VRLGSEKNSRNASSSESSSAQMRDTSDLEIPDSTPRAWTRSSTFLVETPCTQASTTTANRCQRCWPLGLVPALSDVTTACSVVQNCRLLHRSQQEVALRCAEGRSHEVAQQPS